MCRADQISHRFLTDEIALGPHYRNCALHFLGDLAALLIMWFVSTGKHTEKQHRFVEGVRLFGCGSWRFII